MSAEIQKITDTETFDTELGFMQEALTTDTVHVRSRIFERISRTATRQVCSLLTQEINTLLDPSLQPQPDVATV